MSQITINGAGTCPHCGKGVQFLASRKGVVPVDVGSTISIIPANAAPLGWISNPVAAKQYLEIVTADCALCSKPIIAIQFHKLVRLNTGAERLEYLGSRLVWPASAARKPLPQGVPVHLAEDYRESSVVINDSEKASAALSRRCLQSLLREVGNTQGKDLFDQIGEVLPTLPGYLQQQLDAVRNIGNFAAHPQKSKATGEIIDVEPGEAEWNLDVLDLLFDFYYEQPRIAKEKRNALDKKLADAGKPPMK
jgi:Domain of unknown function (DUF4145)